jgi:hypothetical protein
MVSTVSRREEKRQAGVDAMSNAAKIHAELAGGRPPASELKTASEAITAAGMLHRELQRRIAAHEELKGAVVIAYVDAGLTTAYTQPYISGKEADLREFFTTHPVIMLGLQFVIEDTKAERRLVGVKPFLVTKQVIGWMRDLADRSDGFTH